MTRINLFRRPGHDLVEKHARTEAMLEPQMFCQAVLVLERSSADFAQNGLSYQVGISVVAICAARGRERGHAFQAFYATVRGKRQSKLFFT